ncbi:MAG: class I SAM-dependent methyltransferase [Acidobacteriota bacterium]
MLSLYGRSYAARYRTIADLIPPHASVLDLCCGPATLFHRYLRYKNVDYTGLDLSQAFIRRLQSRGGHGQVRNIQDLAPLPQADFVIMHASLYHFLPDAKPVVDRMLTAARRQVIIAEPIRNIVDCKNRLAAKIARRLTDPGDGQSAHRFTSESLDRFFFPYMQRVQNSFLIPGGREKVFVINATPDRDERDSPLVITNLPVTSGAGVPRS